MSERISIPLPRDDCGIEARGHHPNGIQVLRFAVPQRQSGQGVLIDRIDCRVHSDDRGRVGIYLLHHAAGAMEVFDHDPDRFVAVLAQEAGKPVTWTPTGILFVAEYCFSVAPVEELDDRGRCGADPWERWLAGESEVKPGGGGLMISGRQALARLGLGDEYRPPAQPDWRSSCSRR